MSACYEVTVEREDGVWACVVDGLPPHVIGAIDVTSFRALEEEIRGLVSDLTDSEPDSFRLAWRYLAGGKDITEAVEALRSAEAEAADAERRRAEVRSWALRRLDGAGLPQSAIGEVAGVTGKRISQLLKAS